MTTLRTSAQFNADGRLHVDVPTKLPPGQIEVLLVIGADRTKDVGRGYDFSDIAGMLSWRGDAMAVQRNIRNEW